MNEVDCARYRLDWPAGNAEHAAQCAPCRAWAAGVERYDAAVRQRPAFNISAQFTDRLLAEVQTDRRSERRQRQARWWVAGISIAAMVMLVIGATRMPVSEPSAGPAVAAPQVARLPDPVLPAMFGEARTAMLAATQRAASAPAKVSDVRPSLPAWPAADGLQLALAPASKTFEGARAGMADGFEPVTRSAQRAVQLFWNAAPVPEATSKP